MAMAKTALKIGAALITVQDFVGYIYYSIGPKSRRYCNTGGTIRC